MATAIVALEGLLKRLYFPNQVTNHFYRCFKFSIVCATAADIPGTPGSPIEYGHVPDRRVHIAMMGERHVFWRTPHPTTFSFVRRCVASRTHARKSCSDDPQGALHYDACHHHHLTTNRAADAKRFHPSLFQRCKNKSRDHASRALRRARSEGRVTLKRRWICFAGSWASFWGPSKGRTEYGEPRFESASNHGERCLRRRLVPRDMQT